MSDTAMRQYLDTLAPKREHRIGILIAAGIGFVLGFVLVMRHPVSDYYYLSCSFWDHPFMFGCHGSEVAGLHRLISALLWGVFDAVIGAALAVAIRLVRA